jgi:fatty acid desaturase
MVETALPSTKPEGWTRAALRGEIARARAHLLSVGSYESLTAPQPGLVLATAAFGWTVVLLGWFLVSWGSPLLLPVALLAIGSAQRTLGNALHDSAHGNGLRACWLNDWLFAVPMFESFRAYRSAHLAHHANLGDEALDPDYLAAPATGALGAWQLYRRYFFDPGMWRGNLLGPRGIGAAARVRALAFWSLLVGLLALATGAKALVFLGLWLLARGSTYHAIKVFTELADHVGLQPGSIYSFTRNAPKNWLSIWLHPFSDSYHLAHHLIPRVATCRLSALHAALWTLEEYRRGCHCDAYLFGAGSVAQSWLHTRQLSPASLSNVEDDWVVQETSA